MNPWPALELIRNQAAVAAVWRHYLEEDWPAFTAAFLARQPEPAAYYPCPRNCGCAHEVICHRAESTASLDPRHSARNAAGPREGLEPQPSLVAVCRCESWNCDDIPLQPDDIVVWQLSWAKLAQALCRAFGLDARNAEFGLDNTRQVGAWSAAAVPVLLTIQAEAQRLRGVIADLGVRLHQPFILLAPTSRLLDARSLELFAQAKAGFFDLASHVVMTPQGLLHCRRPAGDLFAPFTPQPKEADEDLARRAFALVQQLDSGSALKPPTPLTVFRLYCIEELSAGRIARKFGCSKATVISRLQLIAARTGVRPEALRRVSPHLSKLEEDIADPRAARLHRKRLIYDEEEQEE